MTDSATMNILRQIFGEQNYIVFCGKWIVDVCVSRWNTIN